MFIVKTTSQHLVTSPDTHRFIPPRWGLGLIEPAACYKQVAPLALGNSPYSTCIRSEPFAA